MRSCLIDVDVISEEQLLASGLPYVWMVDGSIKRVVDWCSNLQNEDVCWRLRESPSSVSMYNAGSCSRAVVNPRSSTGVYLYTACCKYCLLIACSAREL